MPGIYNFLPEKNTVLNKVVNGYIPRIVTVPFRQESDVVCTPVVAAGDIVAEGQMIASPENTSYGAAIHSPVPGIVRDIIPCTLPNGRQCLSAVISVQGSFSFLGKADHELDWKVFTSSSLLSIIAERGIVNTFKINEPISLSSQIKKLMHTTAVQERKVVVRLFDEDPTCRTDSLLTKFKYDQIREGASIAAKAFGASSIVFFYDRKRQDLELLSDTEKEYDPVIAYAGFKTVGYYSGFKKKILREGNKFENIRKIGGINENDLFIDSSTLVMLYEAVVKGYPAAKSYVYVSGDCLNTSGLLCFRVGTKYPDIVNQMGGFTKNPAKIIVNGFMTGYAPSCYEVSVTKYVKSVAFVSKKEVKLSKQLDCIHCGRCRRICPEGLYPDLIYMQVTGRVPKNTIIIRSVSLCSECSLCNSVCSSRLPLCQYIKMLEKTEK